MTLTADRRAELIGGCPLFTGLAPRGPDRRRRGGDRGRVPGRPRDRARGRDRDRVLHRRQRPGEGRPDGDDRRAPRSGRVLRRAVGPGRRAARGPGRGGGADHLPRDRVVGLRAGAARRAGGGPRRPPRRCRPAPRGDHGPPDTDGPTCDRRRALAGPPSLPSGTVTFLFTDIEGSTRLVAELGDARLRRAPRADRGLSGGASRAEGGMPFGTEGDAIFVVFPTRRAGGPGGGRRRSARSPPSRGRTTPGPRPDGPAHR